MQSLKEIRDRYEDLKIELMYIEWCMENGEQCDKNQEEVEQAFKEAEMEYEALFY